MRSFNKIFIIGLQKTGTSTTTTALRVLGLEIAHYGEHRGLAPEIRDGFSNPLRILERYVGLADMPVPAVYKRLDCLYPGSLFILTTRDVNTWVESMRTMLVRQGRGIMRPFSESEKIFYRMDRFDKRECIRKNLEHTRDVMNYFGSRPGDLLVLDFSYSLLRRVAWTFGIRWRGKSRWEELCAFLGTKVPEREFPHAGFTKRGIPYFAVRFRMLIRERYPALYKTLKKVYRR